MAGRGGARLHPGLQEGLNAPPKACSMMGIFETVFYRSLTAEPYQGPALLAHAILRV